MEGAGHRPFLFIPAKMDKSEVNLAIKKAAQAIIGRSSLSSKAGPKLKCNRCGDVIQSLFRHDFVQCKCGTCFIDGGSDYTRIGFTNESDFELLEENERNQTEN